MNKNTLLFVLLCAATFFGLNIFFSYQRDKENRAILQEQEALASKKRIENKADFERRTAPLSTLPIVELAVEPQGSTEAYGILTKQNVLTISWKAPQPQVIFVKGDEKHLVTRDSIVEGVVLYAPKDFTTLDIASVPSVGSYDLQLVTFPQNGSPSVYLGEYVDGLLSLPMGPIKQNAIALYKTEEGFLPLGFYDSNSNLLIKLQEMPILARVCNPVSNEPKTVNKEQKYYVLENDTLQLVFTNVGGSLAEINLPFESKENTRSVVKEIGFDRTIEKDYQTQALFPLHPYLTATSSEEVAPKLGGYYPLLRRNLAPEYYALNTVSDYPELAHLNFTVKEFTKDKIVFEAQESYRKITKTYKLGQGDDEIPYTFDLDIKIDGISKGLWLSSGIPEVEIMSNSSSPQIEYRLTRKGKGEMQKLDLPKPKEVINVSSVAPDWIVNSNGYLGVIMNPKQSMQNVAGYRAISIPGEIVPTRLSVIDPQYQPYEACKYPGYQVLLPFPNQGGSFSYRFYTGPFEENTLKSVDKLIAKSTGSNPGFIASRAFYGWFSFISEPFAKFLFVVMKFFYNITHSWAAAIVLLTVFLRVLLYPLNAWSLKSMYRMKEISPEVQAIQKKYKKDPKKAQMEIMALYREKKVNPFTGCLPVLIQLPFLIGMFDLLKSSFQLRGASFIPGWIDNLTAPDVLFSWKQPIFFIGNEFHLLPIILGVVMFFQSRMSNPTAVKKDKSEMTDQERQQKAMGTIMAVVFTVMFYHFPSGLNLYWLSSMLLAILQQWLTNKFMGAKKEKAVSKKGKA